VLAVSVLGSGIAALDATVVNIALPAIGRDFGTGVAALQWVMNGYTLTLAAFLLIGGSLGDRFGRRKVYLIGTVWFALASAACGLAPDVTFLIITRVLQGVGAALLVPGSLAILEASFRPADRARAIGAWSGLGGIALAAGPLVGGYLISAASWRWIFFINVPIAVIVVVLSARHLPESRSPDASGATDYLGAAAVVVFLSGITFAFIEAPALGWSSPAVLIMALLGVGLAVFLAGRIGLLATPDRPSPAAECGPPGDRCGPGLAHVCSVRAQLRAVRPAGGGRVRARDRDHGRAAHRHRHELGAR
jgi:EmrB/QacA subfamily drug resistance transporter